ncbi:hypothetical protein OAO01_02070 [Oligoflexia bacterium]|nr:hypothetical protein [Oligoflexia bacterium]
MPRSKTCRASGVQFIITDDELEFYRKMEVSEPKLCPAERKRRRLAWATFRTLHRRRCDATGENILSMYAPEVEHPVYHTTYWWSDKWDPLEYGQTFDFKRPFFEQFNEVFQKTPVLHQSVINSENCEYINMAGDCKNCYLSFYLDFCEDCYYVQDCNGNTSCMDCLGVKGSELCYECIDCANGYALLFSQRCVNCSNSYFLTDCRGCQNCIGCFNLVNKNYYVYNKPATKAEFENLKKELCRAEKIKELNDFVAATSTSFPKKHCFGYSNEDCSGDFVHNARNSQHCFHAYELENVKYADYFFHVHDCMDVSIYGNQSEWLYNCLKTGEQCSNNICCLCCWSGSSNNAYCHLVIGTKNCFGCSALRHAQYCILNKSYTKHEYEKLSAKIIAHMRETGEWGEFFPIAMSPFGYNESCAQDYFPLTKDEVLKNGYQWREEDVSTRGAVAGAADQAQAAANIPSQIEDVDDRILKEVFRCEVTEKPFRFIKPELEFYRKMCLPLPHLCSDERHTRRLALRNPSNLWHRACASCKVELETSYAPERPEKVLCEACYLQVLE